MSVIETDAVPRYPIPTHPVYLSQQYSNELPSLDFLLSKLSIEEFKSLFFLLLKDFIAYEDYLTYVKRDKNFLKQEFIELCEAKGFNQNDIIELFGTLKNFEILDKLGTCQHIFKHVNCSHRIDIFWKFLYSLSEEVEDREVGSIKEKLLKNSYDQELDSMEEVLCFSLMKNIFQETDLSRLKEAFSHKPECLSLIQKFEEESSYYRIRKPTLNQPCGIAVIINHEDFYKVNKNSPTLSKRDGSIKDVGKLEKLWKQFGFITKVYNRMMTDKEVLQLFKDMASQDHSNYDVFVVCYLSHGDDNVLFASNSEQIPIRELENLMANKCPTLVGKPKLFFIQACQGDEIQQGLRMNANFLHPRTNVQTDGPLVHKPYNRAYMDTPFFCDVLRVVSSYPGFVSYRSPSEGSWFISSLVEVMQSYGDKLAMISIIEKVTKDVAKKNAFLSLSLQNCKQIVQHSSTLRYALKLHKVKM